MVLFYLLARLTFPQSKIEITKLAWSVKGVKEVNNEIQIIDKSSIKNIARDHSFIRRNQSETYF